MLENLSVRAEIMILKALKIFGGKLGPCSTGFLSYDLTALGFTVVTFLLGGIDSNIFCSCIHMST